MGPGATRGFLTVLICGLLMLVAGCDDLRETEGENGGSGSESAETSNGPEGEGQGDGASEGGAGTAGGADGESGSGEGGGGQAAGGQGSGASGGSGGSGGDGGGGGVSIREIALNPSDYRRQAVVLEGTGTYVGSGFLIDDGTGSLIAIGPVPRTRVDGRRIRVEGTIRRQSQFLFSELREDAAAVDRLRVLQRAPRGAGEPYIDPSGITPVG